MTTAAEKDHFFGSDPDQLAAMTSSRPTGHGPVRAYDWIRSHTSQRATKGAIRDLGTNRSFTSSELDHRIDAMAAHLTSLGIGRGDRVAVLAQAWSSLTSNLPAPEPAQFVYC